MRNLNVGKVTGEEGNSGGKMTRPQRKTKLDEIDKLLLIDAKVNAYSLTERAKLEEERAALVSTLGPSSRD